MATHLSTTTAVARTKSPMEGKQSRFSKICVFCGSAKGKKDCYEDAAVELGKELVPSYMHIHRFLLGLGAFMIWVFPVPDQLSRKVDLVYGGGSVGLMGVVSKVVLDGGGSVLGIIPTALMGKELTGETMGEIKPVADMHQRKAEMVRNSDAFIALPGGYGTMEELFEVITWAQLGIHNKPVGLLNVDGYYNSLLSFIDLAVDDGFIKPLQRQIVVSSPSAKELVQKLEEYTPIEDEVVATLRWELDHVDYGSAFQAAVAS